MQRAHRQRSVLSLQVTLHIEGDSSSDVGLGAYAIDRLLHLAMATVSSFHGVGGGWQQGIIQEGQRLFQIGGEEFLQRLADLSEAADAPPKLGQLGERRLGAAPPVEETVDLIHDVAQVAHGRLTTADPGQQAFLRRCQVVLHKQMTMIKQIADLLLKAVLPAGWPAHRAPRTAPRQLRHRGLELLARPADRFEHRFGQLRDGVELTDLVFHVSEHLGDGNWIQSGRIRRDPEQCLGMGIERVLESPEEGNDVLMFRIVVQDLVQQAVETAVLNDGQHAERTIVELVGGNIPGKVL